MPRMRRTPQDLHQSNAAAIHRRILSAGFEQLRVQKIPAPGPLAIYWVIENP